MPYTWRRFIIRFPLNSSLRVVRGGLISAAAGGVFTRILSITTTKNRSRVNVTRQTYKLMFVPRFFILFHLHDLCPFVKFNSSILSGFLTRGRRRRLGGWWRRCLLDCRGLESQLPGLRPLLVQLPLLQLRGHLPHEAGLPGLRGPHRGSAQHAGAGPSLQRRLGRRGVTSRGGIGGHNGELAV